VKSEPRSLLRSFGIGFAKFLGAYLVTVTYAAIIIQFRSPCFSAPLVRDIVGCLAYLFFSGIGFSGPASIIGLVAELACNMGKFKGWIFLGVTFVILSQGWVLDWLEKVLK
jgi:hypothetical protein